jgi:hypothetical protein
MPVGLVWVLGDEGVRMGLEEHWILGIQETSILLAFTGRKLPVYSISLWSCLILSRYSSLGVMSIR